MHIIHTYIYIVIYTRTRRISLCREEEQRASPFYRHLRFFSSWSSSPRLRSPWPRVPLKPPFTSCTRRSPPSMTSSPTTSAPSPPSSAGPPFPSLPFPSSFLHRIDADAVPRGGCFSGSRIIVDPLQFLMKFYSFGNLFINQAKMKAGIENWSSQNFRPGAGHDQKIRRF